LELQVKKFFYPLAAFHPLENHWVALMILSSIILSFNEPLNRNSYLAFSVAVPFLWAKQFSVSICNPQLWLRLCRATLYLYEKIFTS